MSVPADKIAKPAPGTLVTALLVLVAAAALGVWVLVEATLLIAFAPNGQLGEGWHWLAATGAGPGPVAALGFGAALCAALWVVWRIRHRGAGHARSAAGLWVPGGFLALMLLLAFAMQGSDDARWSVGATMLVMLGGRLCFGAMVWEALDGGRILRGFMGLLGRMRWFVLAVFAVLPVMLTPLVKVTVTGDEPSYIYIAQSLYHTGDFQFPPDEMRRHNERLGLPLEWMPHVDTDEHGVQWIRHNVVPALVVMPAVVLGEVTGWNIVALCRGTMLLLFGLTLCLMALLAARMTGLWGPSLLATALLGLSFPLLGMSYQVYPDAMVMPLVVAALLAMVPGLRGVRPLTTGEVIRVALVCCALPWFHSKYAMMSAALFAVAVVLNYPWRVGAAIRVAAVVVAGAGLYLAVNIPLMGHFLWTQAKPDFAPLYGLTAMFADGHSGLFAYAPFVLLLPAGAWAMRRHGGRWRFPAAVILLTAAMWVPTGMLCWEGQATALRYLAPVAVAWVAWLAAALGALRGRALTAAAALATVPLLMAPWFLWDPWRGYMASLQGVRVLPTMPFKPFSWHELFAQYRWLSHGIDSPEGLRHGLVIIGAGAGAALAIAMGGRRSWLPVAGLAAAIAALVIAGRVLESPNWTVTASRMFRRQCRAVDAVHEAGHRALRLQLPAGLKPMERRSHAYTKPDAWLFFTPVAGESWLTDGPSLRLSAGSHEWRLVGAAAGREPQTTGALEMFVTGMEPYKPDTWRVEVPAGVRIGEPSTGEGVVLMEGRFGPAKRTKTLDFRLKRHGEIEVALNHLEIDYLGPETSAPLTASETDATP